MTKNGEIGKEITHIEIKITALLLINAVLEDAA